MSNFFRLLRSPRFLFKSSQPITFFIEQVRLLNDEKAMKDFAKEHGITKDKTVTALKSGDYFKRVRGGGLDTEYLVDKAFDRREALLTNDLNKLYAEASDAADSSAGNFALTAGLSLFGGGFGSIGSGGFKGVFSKMMTSPAFKSSVGKRGSGLSGLFDGFLHLTGLKSSSDTVKQREEFLRRDFSTLRERFSLREKRYKLNRGFDTKLIFQAQREARLSKQILNLKMNEREDALRASRVSAGVRFAREEASLEGRLELLTNSIAFANKESVLRNEELNSGYYAMLRSSEIEKANLSGYTQIALSERRAAVEAVTQDYSSGIMRALRSLGVEDPKLSASEQGMEQTKKYQDILNSVSDLSQAQSQLAVATQKIERGLSQKLFGFSMSSDKLSETLRQGELNYLFGVRGQSIASAEKFSRLSIQQSTTAEMLGLLQNEKASVFSDISQRIRNLQRLREVSLDQIDYNLDKFLSGLRNKAEQRDLAFTDDLVRIAGGQDISSFYMSSYLNSQRQQQSALTQGLSSVLGYFGGGNSGIGAPTTPRGGGLDELIERLSGV